MAGHTELRTAARPVMPRDSHEWTVHDLEQLPDDGLQYELLDGVLLVSPAPVPKHQRAVVAMLLLLHAACPPELEVFVSPLDWQPDERTSLQPDVLVVRRDLVDGSYQPAGEAIGDRSVTLPRPYPVTVTPADLV